MSKIPVNMETLGIKERLILLMILPPTGSILDIKLIRELRESLVLTEDERKAIDIVEAEGGGLTWDETKESPKSMEFSERTYQIVKEALEDLDKKKQLREDFIPLWERFVEVREED